jgi:hypothetical protein
MASQAEFCATCYREFLKPLHHFHPFVCDAQVGTSCDVLLYALGAVVSVTTFVEAVTN